LSAYLHGGNRENGMIFASAMAALGALFSPPFRKALWKSLGLSIVVIVALWFGIEALFQSAMLPMLAEIMPDMPAWIEGLSTAAGWVAGLALAVLLAFLIGPISALIASLFLDDVAEVVERDDYPAVARGKAMPILPGLMLSGKFFGVVILGNLLALLLLLIPGVNLVAFFVVNGYLLGREYFEFAALRYRGEAEAKSLRGGYAGTVFAAGLVIAGFMAVPFLNLLTPLFAAAMMVHLHQRISMREGGLQERASDIRPARRPV
jgi:CysZ protein